MKYNYYLLLAFNFFVFSISHSQQMPLDFSSSLQTFNVWGGSSFSRVQSPTDSNNTVGQFFHAASAAEQGFYIDLTRPIDLDFQSTITLAFYAFDAAQHSVGLKLESGDNANIEMSTNVTSQNTWTTLSFDFSTIGGYGNYSRLTVLIDIGNATPATFLIDDISDGSIPVDPNALDVVYEDLVWSDEFDMVGTNNPIDSNNWFHQTQIPAGGNWYNGEEQHYTNRIENSYVENGNLNIAAIKESFSDQGFTKQYTSARLNSKFAFTYGRVDVRAKLPADNGTWPAIWTLGKNISEAGAYWETQGFGTTPWPACGEIDIMEHGLGAVNHTSSALHTPSSSGNTINVASQEISDVANNYHVYSMNWSPNQITFLVDGVGYYTYNPAFKDANTWPFDNDQYILLNVAMGGIAGTIDPSFTQSSMIIDYVRVYQNTSLGTTDLVEKNFSIYPNPSKDIIHIKTNATIDNVEIYDMYGKLVITQVGDVKSLKVERLTSGMYLLNIYTNGLKTVKKVVID